MTTVEPQGEDIRKAVKWLWDEHNENKDVPMDKLIGDACVKFDLSPRDAEFLARYVKDENF